MRWRAQRFECFLASGLVVCDLERTAVAVHAGSVQRRALETHRDLGQAVGRSCSRPRAVSTVLTVVVVVSLVPVVEPGQVRGLGTKSLSTSTLNGVGRPSKV